ncbi:tetratricopeptide repeat protein [Limnobacter sp.]|uniref:tetratricopeptide repeat protein n=1 Tax=Limnobacter sp. TaxID=2003368 RepID=UPI0025844A12|nr:tetratricopeptide repeat protein [Limnobacter sp.]
MNKCLLALLCVLASPAWAQSVPPGGVTKVQPIITPDALKGGQSTPPLAGFERAAEGGDANAQYQMGMAYLQGDVVKKDLAQAAQWFAMAADQGEDRAQVRLGYLLEFGRGVKRNAAASAQLYEQSALQGNTEAQARYAQCLERGSGVKKDLTKAYAFYLLGDRGGNEQANKAVKRLALTLTEAQKGKAQEMASKVQSTAGRRY